MCLGYVRSDACGTKSCPVSFVNFGCSINARNKPSSSTGVAGFRVCNSFHAVNAWLLRGCGLSGTTCSIGCDVAFRRLLRVKPCKLEPAVVAHDEAPLPENYGPNGLVLAALLFGKLALLSLFKLAPGSAALAAQRHLGEVGYGASWVHAFSGSPPRHA